jgi:hypothetical protein
VSDLHATVFDWPATPTKSDTDADPNGPFSSLLVDTGGILKLTPYGGPLAGSSLTLNVVAGEVVPFPVTRVWTSVTTAVVVGLVGAIVRQGP